MPEVAEIILEPLVALLMAIGKLLFAVFEASARILIPGAVASAESLIQLGPLTLVFGVVWGVSGVYILIQLLEEEPSEPIPWPGVPFLGTREEEQNRVLSDGGEDEDGDSEEPDDEEVAD